MKIRLTCTPLRLTWFHHCSGKTSPKDKEKHHDLHMHSCICIKHTSNYEFAVCVSQLTLKSCTPMQANMNCRSVVTIMMFPIVLMATNTHWTTCCREVRGQGLLDRNACKRLFYKKWSWWTFSPLARFMALSGRSTRRTLKIFTTEMADDLQRKTLSWSTNFDNSCWKARSCLFTN